MSPNDKILPPLPKSDPQSLRWNSKDHFYKTKSGDFWDKNELIREEIEPHQDCDHNFKHTSKGVQCQKCHFGLVGKDLEIRKGKLFSKGKPLGM